MTVLFFLLLGRQILCIAQTQIVPGAAQWESYIKILGKENIGVVAHQASLVNHKTHLIDTLLSLEVNITKVFAPEHGFRGDADAGESVADQKDLKTGLPILSLYGSNKKPSEESLEGINIMLFDLQDVGVRFYTYLSTLHYVMEACAENGIPLIILDRPNPNAHYTDGPILEEDCKSFVGMHPVPIVSGMTIGEYAKMINGEGWLSDGIQCDLRVVPLKNYTHQTTYEIPLRPSPNLPNAHSIALYPSLCLLEPTVISVGRGTEMQFQIYGHPQLPETNFSFTPRPNYGSKNPKLKDQLCHGVDLRNFERPKKIELQWLIQAHRDFPDKEHFFKKGFYRIAGNKKLQKQLAQGMNEQQIRKTWEKDLEKFKKTRKKYLIYP
ncbi:MAG: exo-beta-N-acetylmuramidase NamZ family protein [Flavobacteriaceae bacterium]